MTLETFDFEHLLADVEDGEAEEFNDLRRAVRQASSMRSVRNDIGRAREMIEALRAFEASARAADNEGDSIDRGTGATIQALFMQAVILYVRATHSGSKGRNKLHIVGRLDPSGRDLHNHFVALRDRYLAHYEEPGPWEKSRVVLAIDVSEAKIALSYPHSRHYVRSEDSGGFDALLRAAEKIASEAYKEASLRLNIIINRFFDSDPGFLERLRRRPFNPATFFDPDEVKRYLAGIGSLDPDPVTQPRIIRPDRSWT